ncbi:MULTISPECIES: SulP family inorganic anion transporter [Marinomonas]|uniref:Sulfate permease n=1 Tax=Marinomonas arctica TaxID=383750 RepID=A0A7H1J4C4_9GAMM|nr:MULTISPECIES: sulfate permease [Marinomonas]MCS7488182.1 sulfate:proton symporter [Marinomonas sp. BSi20414]QNT05340.1 sulfate permease [Marinomonas arctica]GGN37298.1 sodium-independent anion transporter [Marinomonas arctica]
MIIERFIPALSWLKTYHRGQFSQDATAAFIVTMLLIPQSLAYAMLAGVPPEVGLYSSILPLVLYALFGTSTSLSVGPVAVASLMTATSLAVIAEQGTASYLTGAITLALLSGAMLIIMGVMKLGMVTNLLSHSVISGFISASGIIIALSQLKHILGIQAHGDNVVTQLLSMLENIGQFKPMTFVIGVSVIAFLLLARRHAKRFLIMLKVPEASAASLAKTAPILGVLSSLAVVYLYDLQSHGVAITGHIPAGLPNLVFTLPSLELIKALALPALMISIIGYVESISVGKTLGAKRREKVKPNQELIGLGAANIASGVSGGFPVTGGFSRSVVNFDAGAVTQLASIMTALGIMIASLFLTPMLYFLPKATLAATIIVAVTTLIDFSILKKTWLFSRSDFYAVLATIVITLLLGVEVGVASGVALSIALHLYRTSKPHVAEVGLIKGSEHFRNVKRYEVETSPQLLCLRPDESLFFANATFLEDHIIDTISQRKDINHVVIQCSAVNEIDFSALEMLEALNLQLKSLDIKLSLSEVKGPVMDHLECSGFLQHLNGKVYLSQFQAYQDITQA